MKFEWETIDDLYQLTQRAKVFGGWKVQTIYRNNSGNTHQSAIFVPDPEHKWEVSETDSIQKLDIKNIPIDLLPLLSRTKNALKMKKILTLYDLVMCCEIDLLRTHNIGQKSLRDIKENLNKLNLSLLGTYKR